MEVAIARGKRQQRSKLERRGIVEETLRPGASVTGVAQAHGIRASQVYHWRRLHRQGLLEVEAGTATLVPVRLTDAVRGAGAKPLPQAYSGAIDMHLERAHLHIEGAADPASLRVVLEYLLG